MQGITSEGAHIMGHIAVCAQRSKEEENGLKARFCVCAHMDDYGVLV